MRMFIANCTKQNHEFNYRLPESNRVITQSIPVGTQIQISGGDRLTREDIKAIISQHEIYGLIDVERIGAVAEYTGLCFSVDKMVPGKIIVDLFEHNNEQLEKRGEQTRRETAVAMNNILENEAERQGRPETLREMEVSIREENDPLPGTKDASAAYRVTREGTRERNARVARQRKREPA